MSEKEQVKISGYIGRKCETIDDFIECIEHYLHWRKGYYEKSQDKFNMEKESNGLIERIKQGWIIVGNKGE